MARIIRRVVGNKKRGAALIAALQVIALILIGFLSFFGGPQRSPKAPAETPVSAPAQGQTQTAEAQTETAQPLTAAELTAAAKADLRASAIAGTKLSGPYAAEVFNLATTRAAEAANSELPNNATLTTDREDYAPYSYVYITGTGFQPGETVNMIVVELAPNPQSFQPWDVVADANLMILNDDANRDEIVAIAKAMNEGKVHICQRNLKGYLFTLIVVFFDPGSKEQKNVS